MANINIDQLAAEIAKGLQEYSQDVVEGVNARSIKIAKKAVKTLKEKSPKNTGWYGRTWKIKTETFYGEPDKLTVHNEYNYRLTHLLEHGHAKAGGGRVEAKPHIADVEKEVIDTFVKEVEEVIKNGPS